MARTNIAAQTLPGSYPTIPLVANSRDVVETAADAVNQNMTPLVRKKTVIIAHNTHATTAYTATVTSVADASGRTGDLGPYTLQAGEIAIIGGPMDTAGWVQPADSDDPGALYFEANNAAVKFIVLTLP